MRTKVTNQRRIVLEQLKAQAFENTLKSISTEEYQKNEDLRIEYLNLIDVFNELSEIGNWLDFYTNIDRAFSLLIESRPNESEKIFNTYRQLSTLFRVIESNKKTIDAKLSEYNAVIEDLDTIEEEQLKMKKGLQVCS